MPSTPSPSDQPSHPVAALIVRWRAVIYLLLLLAALAVAAAESRYGRPWPAPPDVEADD